MEEKLSQSSIPVSSSVSPDNDEWVLEPFAVTLQRLKMIKPANARKTVSTGRAFFVQTGMTLMIAGVGLIGAGRLLDMTQDGEFFTTFPEAFTLVPVLFCLKGNLEMTLASRVSTLANMGLLEKRSDIKRVAISNITLNQCLAAGVSLLAAAMTALQTYFSGTPYSWQRFFTLLLAAVLTALSASGMMGSTMMTLIVVCRKLGLDPDNIATPVAASFGDFLTQLLMVGFGTLALKISEGVPILIYVLVALCLVHGCVCGYIAAKDRLTRDVLKYGAWANIASMAIGIGGGRIFGISQGRFPEIAAYQPVINGVGGNLVSVHAARASTALHAAKAAGHAKPRVLAYFSPIMTFFSVEDESRVVRLLILFAIPAQLIFVLVCWVIDRAFPFSAPFIGLYLIAVLIQVALLLWTCGWLVRLLWRCRIDPDNAAIPLLTALGDLLGSTLLFAVFTILTTTSHLLVLPSQLDRLTMDLNHVNATTASV